MGDRPRRNGPRAAPLRRRGRRAPLPGAPGAADAFHLATGRARDRLGLRSGQRSRCGSQRDRSARRPAGPGAQRLGGASTSWTCSSSRTPGRSRCTSRWESPCGAWWRSAGCRRSATTTTTGGSASDSPAASCRRCWRWPFRPTCHGCGTSASTASPPASCASGAASAQPSSRTSSTSIVHVRVEPPPSVGGCEPSSGMGERRAAGRATDARRAAQGHRAGHRARRAAERSRRRPAHHLAGRRRGARLSRRAGAAGGAPQGAAGIRGGPLRARPRRQADPPRPLPPRRVPCRGSDHLPEPVRGLRQRAAGGALLRRPGAGEPLPGVRCGHRAARPAA